jgi:ribosomal protein S18 acetylase RimI-like enzyme
MRWRQRTGTTGGLVSADPSSGWRLLSIAVHPDYRRVRVGRRLVEAFHEDLLRDNHLAYEASVQTTNAASQRLFQSLRGVVLRESGGTVVYRVVVPMADGEPGRPRPSSPGSLSP